MILKKLIKAKFWVSTSSPSYRSPPCCVLRYNLGVFWKYGVSALKVLRPGVVVARSTDPPYHRWSFARFLPRIFVFNPRAVREEPVVDKIALRYVLCQVLLFPPCQLLTHQTSIGIFIYLSSGVDSDRISIQTRCHSTAGINECSGAHVFEVSYSHGWKLTFAYVGLPCIVWRCDTPSNGQWRWVCKLLRSVQ